MMTLANELKDTTVAWLQSPADFWLYKRIRPHTVHQFIVRHQPVGVIYEMLKDRKCFWG